MPNRIGSMIPIGFTALYAMLMVIVLSSGPARAADDCLVAPNSQPPLGSRWYYHIDGAERRHCWYLGPESQKVHHAEPEVEPAARSVAPVRTETAGDRLLAAAQVEPPLAPLPRATAASATAQAGVQEISQGARQGTPYVVQWPDPHQPAGTTDREARGVSTLQGINTENEVRPAAAAGAARHARTIMLIGVILLVASALAVAGIFQYTIFRIVVGRRRRTYVERGIAEQSFSLPPNRMPLPFTALRPNGLKRAPVEQFNPRDIRQILRALERGAA